jgi:hypothetical protein
VPVGAVWADDGLGGMQTQAAPADVPMRPVDMMVVADLLMMPVAP